MIKEKTTELSRLKKGNPFTWGKLLNIIEFKEYSIVEYRDREEKRNKYCGYIGSKQLNNAFNSFEEAVAYCIARKYDAPCTKAHEYFIRMIKNKEENK